jgi:hypothetical protein
MPEDTCSKMHRLDDGQVFDGDLIESATMKRSSSPGKSVAFGLDRGPAGNDLLQPFADNLGASTNRDWIKDGLVTPTTRQLGG